MTALSVRLYPFFFSYSSSAIARVEYGCFDPHPSGCLLIAYTPPRPVAHHCDSCGIYSGHLRCVYQSLQRHEGSSLLLCVLGSSTSTSLVYQKARLRTRRVTHYPNQHLYGGRHLRTTRQRLLEQTGGALALGEGQNCSPSSTGNVIATYLGRSY